MQKIIPFLWFDDQAEEAARFYASVFPDSRVGRVTRYGESAAKASGRPAGSAMTVELVLAGQRFVALNGGPMFQFSEAVSFVVDCASQEEVDHYWQALSDGGEEGPCGWLKDRYGLSWQVVPAVLDELLGDPDAGRAQRAMQAMLGMSKIDIDGLRSAADEEETR